MKFSFTKSMVWFFNDEEDDLVKDAVVLSLVSSRLNSSLPLKEFRNDGFTGMNYLLPLSRPEVKDEDILEDIILLKITVQ